MDNRIVDVRIEDRSLDPVSAEVWVTVTPERLTPTTEVRGRFMGPSSPYASTVEVAYPLAPLRRPEHAVPGALRFRVVIPEASLWSPQAPYLYAGVIDLWQDGQRCDRVRLNHGLRQVAIGPHGLRVNGRPLTLKGRVWDARFPDQAPALHQDGYNALLAPLRPEAAGAWDAGDRYGFLVLGRLEPEGLTAPLLHTLSGRPCCFGWIVGPEWLTDGRLGGLVEALRNPPLVGVELGHDAEYPSSECALPEWVRFVLRRPALGGARATWGVELAEGPSRATPSGQGPLLLGHVETEPSRG